MSGITRVISSLLLCLAVLVFAGFTGARSKENRPAVMVGLGNMGNISDYIAVLKFGNTQQKAAAAYWLGQQHAIAARAVDSLVELLGDRTAVDTSQYREGAKERKPTLGEEAAIALVQIGRPSIQPLIHVLKKSPLPEARKNAAWALGELHDTGATIEGQQPS